ncbi:MAG: hypothetical protein U5R06_20395 [candidate division KSB1 bacterium]|nr:hypothetical protein [candidate division KSB1 bacterium]
MKKIVIAVLLIFAAGCSKRELPQTPTYGAPELAVQTAPKVLSPGKTYRVEVTVESDNQVDSVALSMRDKNGSVLYTWYLFDDGGALHPDDGDVAAFDGVFTQRIHYNTASGDDQELVWHFTAGDEKDQQSEPVEWSLVGLANPNTPPVITRIEAPEELPSGFSGSRFITVSVTDSNGLQDLQGVSYTAHLNDTKIFENRIDRSTSPGEFEQQITAEFASGRKTGDYEFIFRARDVSGAVSEPVSRSISIYNDPPILGEPAHVDSVLRPEQGFRKTFLITVPVTDDQGLSDVRRVWMKWRKADGSFPSSGPYFDLFDNGLPWQEDFADWDQGARGDETADDGVYSIMGTFDAQQPPGEYTFTFYALDFAGNESDSTTTHLLLYTEEN